MHASAQANTLRKEQVPPSTLQQHQAIWQGHGLAGLKPFWTSHVECERAKTVQKILDGIRLNPRHYRPGPILNILQHPLTAQSERANIRTVTILCKTFWRKYALKKRLDERYMDAYTRQSNKFREALATKVSPDQHATYTRMLRADFFGGEPPIDQNLNHELIASIHDIPSSAKLHAIHHEIYEVKSP